MLAAYHISDTERLIFEKYAKELACEIKYTKLPPTLENADFAKGCDGILLETYPVENALLKVWADYGIKVISNISIGYDHIDVKAARELGIAVTRSNYPPEGVAEYTIMLILMLLRKAKYSLHRMDAGDFSLKGREGSELKDLTVGIIGTGNIGSRVAQLLSSFGCRLLVYSLEENPALTGIAAYTDLDELYAKSDIITLHIPGSAANTHFIDEAAISKMKDGVIIINDARGGLIDTKALTDALLTGKVGAAALDVLEGEDGFFSHDFAGRPVPVKEFGILNSLQNVILTPHTAFYTVQNMETMVRVSVENCITELSGTPSIYRVN